MFPIKVNFLNLILHPSELKLDLRKGQLACGTTNS